MRNKVIKGEWYEFEGHKDCLLQYNDGAYAKGWWNGSYGTYWCFNGIARIAKPASEKMLKKYGVTKEMKEIKEKKKLNLSLIYLVASVIQLISFASFLIKGDFAIANTNLILAILLFNRYEDSEKVTMSVETKDLLRVINIDKFRNN